VASSVPDALRVGDRGEFDLVVVGVPPFGGLAVLDDVRVAFPSSVVLALVEDPDPVFSGQVRGLGAQEVLSRSGLTPADFAAAVTRLVETSNPRSEIAARVAHVEGLLAAVSEGILVQSATGRVVLANERALEMLQVPREVLISADLTAAGIEFRSAAGRLLERDQLPDAVARRTRRPVPPVLLQVRRGDGELRWFEATTSPLVHADQEVPYAVVTAIRDMTETQAAQETMVSAERRERLLLEYAGEGYLLLDAHGVVTESSELVERFWPQQLVGRELRELVVDDDRADLALLLDDVTARRVSPLRAEARVVDARGEIRWVELTFANRLDEPSLIGIVVNLRDITNRKLAEESATRLSAILESTEDAVFSETLDGVITSWNSAAERLYGYAAPEAVGGSSLIIVPADRLNGVLDVRSRVLKRNRVELAETVRRRKDGSTVAVSLMVTPLVDSAGNLIGSSTTSRLPAARRDEGGEPSRAQDHFRLGFEHGAIGMAMVDGSDHFTLVNSALCRLLGREEDELLGHALVEFLHTGDLEARRGAAPSPADAGRFQGERHFVRPDGTIVTALVEMSSIRGDDGTPYHFCQVQDVTGWKRSEAALGHHALHDPLTGLANREMLSARLDLLIARNRHDETTSAVLAIDLDRFKVVNDGLGHAASATVLRLLSEFPASL